MVFSDVIAKFVDAVNDRVLTDTRKLRADTFIAPCAKRTHRHTERDGGIVLAQRYAWDSIRFSLNSEFGLISHSKTPLTGHNRGDALLGLLR